MSIPPPEPLSAETLTALRKWSDDVRSGKHPEADKKERGWANDVARLLATLDLALTYLDNPALREAVLALLGEDPEGDNVVEARARALAIAPLTPVGPDRDSWVDGWRAAEDSIRPPASPRSKIERLFNNTYTTSRNRKRD